MTNPYFLDRVAREATDCATAARELADKFRGIDPAGEKLAEQICDTLIALAYDALGETQPIEPVGWRKKRRPNGKDE